jgi:hypothetical protein
MSAHLPALAQLDQVLRLEIIPEKEKDELYNVVALGEKGLLVSTQPSYPVASRNGWSLVRYDTLLNKVWENFYPIDSRMMPTKVYKDDTYFYVLLTEKESLDIQIFRLDYVTGYSELIKGSTLAYMMDINSFKVLGSTAYIGGMVKYRPVVVAFNIFDRRSRVLPGLYEPNSEISTIDVDNFHYVANIITYNTHRRKCNLTIRSFDNGGRLLKNLTMQSQKEKSLQTGKVTPLNEEEQMVIGNYSLRCSPYSQGLYMAKLNGDNQEFIKYYQFNDFQNFFSFMKPRRQERVRNRISKRREKGKEYLLRYRLLLHDIIERDDQYILVGEAYYPQYRSSSVPGAFYGRFYNDRIFDGYKYTHAVVCGFDKKGNLLWDNSFEIDDFTSYHLEEVVKVALDDDRIVLVYPKEGQLNTKVIKDSEVLITKENYPIKTNYETDKVMNSEDASVSLWYGKYFITWGFQEISNGKESGVRNTRKVFYLNKVTYRSDAATLLDKHK